MHQIRLLERSERPGGEEVQPLSFQAINAICNAELNAGGESSAGNAFDLIVRHAVLHRASDVHFEPWEQSFAIRFRIDGILHDVAQLPRVHQARIVARLKVLSNIITYQAGMPQDGRIDSAATSCRRPLRVSTFPTINGERVIIRVLDSREHEFDLDELGFGVSIVNVLRKIIGRPQGTLLLTGPSSSGKTTTIYALLRELLAKRSPSPHVVTIEDPVEYRLDRVAQTELSPNAGLTFEAALRSLLRQDPEVIVVGEIRDADTARAAIQAGLTGHLVISTIHSGSAAGVFTRLLDMGVEPYLVASSVTGVLAQRLVRVNCPNCSIPYVTENEACTELGLIDDACTFRRGRGCGLCQQIGYTGRTALGELLVMNEEIEERVLERARTSVLHAAALRNGMTPLAAAARERVCEGVTTLEEVRRVVSGGGNH
jgi:type II secretory ATPase GspE/PulE/Tfp pilus assembly ATPase PilB-like protein